MLPGIGASYELGWQDRNCVWHCRTQFVRLRLSTAEGPSTRLEDEGEHGVATTTCAITSAARFAPRATGRIPITRLPGGGCVATLNPNTAVRQALPARWRLG